MPAPNLKNRLHKIFNAVVFSTGLGTATVGAVYAVDGMTPATTQDFDAARACDAQVAQHKPCTNEQVDSLRNIRTSFQNDALGLTLLMGGYMMMLGAHEREDKRKRAASPTPIGQ